MRALGIESTAHTFGAGVVEDGKVLSNIRDMYRPEKGGIHPREAADHHVSAGGDVVRKAMDESGTSEEDIDLVAFSKGPGLGPCLRVGATIARMISLKNGIPIIGVNHCVAHLEVGSLLGSNDPVLLYASGGNTQIIAHISNRYQVLGETLDIGIGNMLDKLGREMGIPFPAGPRIEELALEADVTSGSGELLELPYSVKGMDISFSGIMTAALAHHRKGVEIGDICRSVQETCFAMLCEVSERAMAHVGSTELLLGGGVACNSRLKKMAGIMALEREARLFAPPFDLAVDNGAMIAHLGLRMFGSGRRHSLEDTMIDQRFRTDQEEVTWKDEKVLERISNPGCEVPLSDQEPSEGMTVGRGAEAIVKTTRWGGLWAVNKIRVRKGYRLLEMDRRINSYRTRNEARMIGLVREAGVRTPFVLDVDRKSGDITMELIRGPRLASHFNVMDRAEQKRALFKIGRITGRLHSHDLIHGDLTTSNFIAVGNGKDMELALLDLSLSERTEEVEKKGVDLRLFFEVFRSTHGGAEDITEEFWRGYRDSYTGWKEAFSKYEEIGRRGRYLSEKWTK